MPLYNPTSSSIDQYLVALGLKSWNFAPILANNEFALTSQTIFTIAVPTLAGQVYTGVKLGIGTAGSGTAPAHFYVGLATNGSTQGVMLAQSSNLASSSSLTTTRAQSFPFSATYPETASGARSVVILMDGTFGTTNVAFIRTANNSEMAAMSTTGPFLWGTAGTGQTALPANSSNLPATYSSGGSNTAYWVALY